MLAWHCVFSRPHQEARAAVELVKQDFHAFLPILDHKPMFPRYLFVEFDHERDPWGKIQSTRGCVGLLRNGFTPAVVPERVVNAIMAYKPEHHEPDQFSPGQAVTIADGPFAGLSGLFVSDRSKRTMALLEIMGRKVEIPMDSVKAA